MKAQSTKRTVSISLEILICSKYLSILRLYSLCQSIDTLRFEERSTRFSESSPYKITCSFSCSSNNCLIMFSSVGISLKPVLMRNNFLWSLILSSALCFCLSVNSFFSDSWYFSSAFCRLLNSFLQKSIAVVVDL